MYKLLLIQQTIKCWYFYLVPEQNTEPFSLGHSSDTSMAANKFQNQRFEVWRNDGCGWKIDIMMKRKRRKKKKILPDSLCHIPKKI